MNSKEKNPQDFCLDFVQEFGLLFLKPSISKVPCHIHENRPANPRPEMRTVSHDGILGPTCWGWGFYAHSLSLYLPPPLELRRPLHSNPLTDWRDIANHSQINSPSPLFSVHDGAGVSNLCFAYAFVHSEKNILHTFSRSMDSSRCARRWRFKLYFPFHQKFAKFFRI